MNALELKTYEIFKNKIGKQEAETVMEYFHTKAGQVFDDKSHELATKKDIGSVREEMVSVRQEIGSLRTELKTDIAETKADLIKWSFVFWIGTILSFIAIVKFVLDK